MLRSRLILLASIGVVVVALAVFLLSSRDDASSGEITSEQAEVAGENASEDGVASEGQSETKGSSSSSKATGSKSDKQGGVLGVVRAEGKVSETAAQHSDAPCQVVDLKSELKETKGYLHEFKLERTLSSSEPLCVMVEGKSVGHTRMKDGRVRIDGRIARSSAKVSAMFCTQGVKCQVSCPEPEKDFWDSIGTEDDSAVGTGFADVDTAEDRELQKEIKALKDVLSRKPAEAPVANWKIVAQHDSSCK